MIVRIQIQSDKLFPVTAADFHSQEVGKFVHIVQHIAGADAFFKIARAGIFEKPEKSHAARPHAGNTEQFKGCGIKNFAQRAEADQQLFGKRFYINSRNCVSQEQFENFIIFE